MEERLGYVLWRAQQAQRAALYTALADIGLTPPQYAALKVLDDAPGISSAEVARRSFVSAQTMQAIVAGLERRGLLRREHRSGQGTMLAARLTDQGRAALAHAEGLARAVEEKQTAGLMDEERRLLIDLLLRCAEALEMPTAEKTSTAAAEHSPLLTGEAQ